MCELRFPSYRQTRAFGLVLLCLLLVSACSRSTPQFKAKNEPWRAQTEMACLRSGEVQMTAWNRPTRRLNGPSFCGAIKPFRVQAVDAGHVRLKPSALVRCPMIPAIDQWMRDVVQPAARQNFGQPVTELSVMASYACRPRNNKRGAKLSEHGFANALDVGGFKLADGRTVKVKTGWRAGGARSSFLRTVHRGACGPFTTVLGPNADRYHQDHFHFDLARHNRKNSYRYCR